MISQIIINRSKFNFYGFFIVLSIILSIIYIYYFLKKEKVEKRLILLSVILAIPFILVGGKYLTILTSKGKVNLITAGLSSYGGAIGLILSSIIYEKITNEKKTKTAYILSLPLMYGISKLGCFFVGCCYGIRYDGIFSVKYPHLHSYTVFPVQLLETITFLMIFIILNIIYKKTKSKNIIWYTILLSALGKFLLDYLRYSHANISISVNQIISIFFIIISIVFIIVNRRKNEKM